MGGFKSREWRKWNSVTKSLCYDIYNSYIWCNNLLYVLYCGNFDTITFYHCIFKLVYKAFYHWFVDMRSVIRGNSYKHPLHPPFTKEYDLIWLDLKILEQPHKTAGAWKWKWKLKNKQTTNP